MKTGFSINQYSIGARVVRRAEKQPVQEQGCQDQVRNLSKSHRVVSTLQRRDAIEARLGARIDRGNEQRAYRLARR